MRTLLNLLKRFVFVSTKLVARTIGMNSKICDTLNNYKATDISPGLSSPV